MSMRVFRFALPLALMAALIATTSGWAADPPPRTAVGPAPRPGAPISAPFGPSGEGFPVGKAAVLLNYMHAESDGVRLRGGEINNNLETTKDMYTIKLRYGIAPGLDIRSTTPLYIIETKNKVTNKIANRRGIGDTAIALHKVLMDQSMGAPLYMSVDFAIVVPTAHVDDSSMDAIGNRAWGVGAGLGLTWFSGSHRLDQEVSCVEFAEGARDYEKPVSIRSNTSYAYALNKHLDIGLESLYEYNPDSETNGMENNDRKHEWYVGPKVMLRYQPAGMFLGLLATFPVDRDYDKASPSDGYRLELKLAKAFSLF